MVHLKVLFDNCKEENHEIVTTFGLVDLSDYSFLVLKVNEVLFFPNNNVMPGAKGRNHMYCI